MSKLKEESDGIAVSSQEPGADLRKYSYDEAVAAAREYFGGDDLSATVWVSKYALKDSDGNIYELTPDDMHRRIASELARVEAKFPNPVAEEELFSLLERFKYIVPQGSPMAGIGNNMQKISLSNCFVIGNEPGKGDSYGGIMRVDERIAQLQKRRCGVGTDLSHIRPAGSPVNNAAITSTGIVPFMERHSNTTREVAQDGRRGALMLTVSVRHPEAEAFVDAKMDTKKVTGANVSVKVHDDFMEAMLKGENYKQQWPIYGPAKVTKEADARKLWDKIIANAHKSAEPGVLWWDRIIQESPADCYAKFGFETVSTNPCGELPLCTGDSCRLLALNLYSYVKNPFTPQASFDFKLFKQHVAIAQRMMDDIVELELEKIDAIIEKIKTDPETEEIKANELSMWLEIREKCNGGRRTGTGVTGEGDMLAALGLRYGTPEATAFAEKVHKSLAIAAYKSSCVMAAERGAFPLYDAELEKDNPFIARIRKADAELDELMSLHGRRNIALLTIAPTGTVSLMTRTTSGIECAFLVGYIRRRKINPNDKNVRVDFVDETGDSWEEYFVFHHHFVTWLQVNGYDPEEVAKLRKEELDAIIEKSPYFKALSNDVDWVEKVRMQGRIQKWIDHSISVTVNLPNSATVELVNDVYVESWRSGCKGCTIYRDGSRSGVLIEKKDKEEVKQAYKDSHAPKRPKVLDCDVVRFTNKGEKWIGFVGLLDGRPYEIFSGPAVMDLPAYVETGRIKKTKTDEGGKYDFLYSDKDGNEQTIEWLNKTFNEEYWNYAKLISGVLRHGMPLPYVVELVNSLHLDDEVLTTWKGGIARMVKKYIPDGVVSDKDCKECGSKSVVYQEGCLTCKNCGSSKCG
jgi:ribonucleoside-diphosphate reductase alpha chain